MSLKHQSKAISENNPIIVFSSLTTQMCLALSKHLGKKDPGIFLTISDSMIEMLSIAGLFSLVNVSNVNLIKKSMDSIVSYAESILNEFSDDMCSHAYGLLFSVACATGSMKIYLKVANEMFSNPSKCVLPSSVNNFIDKLESLETDIDLTCPFPKVIQKMYTISE